MEVPFIDVGPGQVARLAWQVLGSNGPVFNPSGIRYLPPDALGAASGGMGTSLGDAAGALAGINVLLSAGTLAVSMATLAEVKRVSAKVDALLAGQAVTNRKLDQILSKLDRVELKVGEARLATLVDHALKACAVAPGEISFAPLASLADDLADFLSSARATRGVPASFRLGSDVRVGLQRVTHLLRSVRLGVAREYNRAIPDPDLVWHCHPVRDYWDDTDTMAAVFRDLVCTRQVQAWDATSFQAHVAVDARFSFNDAEDHAALQENMNTALVPCFMAVGYDEKPAAEEAVKLVGSVLDELASEMKTETVSPLLDRNFSDALGERVMAAVRQMRFQNENSSGFPPAVLDAAMNAEDSKDGDEILTSYRAWWLHQTDVGLVYRAARECRALTEGYEVIFDATPALSSVTRAQLGDSRMLFTIDQHAAVAGTADRVSR